MLPVFPVGGAFLLLLLPHFYMDCRMTLHLRRFGRLCQPARNYSVNGVVLTFTARQLIEGDGALINYCAITDPAEIQAVTPKARALPDYAVLPRRPHFADDDLSRLALDADESTPAPGEVGAPQLPTAGFVVWLCSFLGLKASDTCAELVLALGEANETPLGEERAAEAADALTQLAASQAAAEVAQDAEDMGQAHPAFEAALANGWTADELADVGAGGDPGPEGGFSAISGLTLGQMGMSTPPPSWRESVTEETVSRDHFYPWQCEDWLPPGGFAFVAPAAPAKLEAPKPEDDDDGVLSIPADALVADDDADDDGGLTVDDSAELAPEDQPDWFEAACAAADAVWDDKTGAPPSQHKLSHRLRKDAVVPATAVFSRPVYNAIIAQLSPLGE